MGRNTSGGASLGAQPAAYAFFCIHLSKAAPVNGDGTFGAGFHANTAGNAHLAIGDSQFFHKIILSAVLYFTVITITDTSIIAYFGMISIGVIYFVHDNFRNGYINKKLTYQVFRGIKNKKLQILCRKW